MEPCIFIKTPLCTHELGNQIFKSVTIENELE